MFYVTIILVYIAFNPSTLECFIAQKENSISNQITTLLIKSPIRERLKKAKHGTS